MANTISAKDIKSKQIFIRHLNTSNDGSTGQSLVQDSDGNLQWDYGSSYTDISDVKTGAYTALLTDTVIRVNGTVTVTLPAIATALNKVYHVKNIGTGVVIVDGNGSETIDGATTQELTAQYDDIHLIASSTEWHIL